MRKENAIFNTKFISEAGSYLTNADYFAYVELKDYACYVIADGIDNDNRKESAKLAVTTAITRFSENPGMSSMKLKSYIKAAHQAILEESKEIRLEASIVIVVTDYKKIRWTHVGNSRLCLIRNGNIKICTRDTSLTQRLADQEEIALDQISYHEERNNLYSYLGQPGHFVPIVSKKRILSDGDIILLETRGIWENVGEAEILDAIDGASKPDDVCSGIEDVILSQRLEVIENYTIAAIFVDKVYINPKAGRNKKIIKICIAIAAVILSVVLAYLLAKYMRNRNNLNLMEKSKEKGITYLEEGNYESAEEQFDKAYDISDNINVSSSSKTGKKISCVEKYDTMTEYIVLAFEAFEKNNIKDANNKIERAIEILEELKNNYDEDVSKFERIVKAYKEAFEYIILAQTGFEDGDSTLGIGEYDKAIDLLQNIGDEDKANTVASLKNDSRSKWFIQEGNIYLKEANEKYKDGDYEKAKLCYEIAENNFNRAKEECGAENVDDEIEAIKSKEESCKNGISEDSNSKLMKEALELEIEGDDFMINEELENAIEKYNKSKEIYESLGIDNKVKEIEQKIGKAQNGMSNAESEKQAKDSFNKGILYLSESQFELALKYLNEAKSTYSSINNQEMKELIDKLIMNIESNNQ